MRDALNFIRHAAERIFRRPCNGNHKHPDGQRFKPKKLPMSEAQYAALKAELFRLRDETANDLRVKVGDAVWCATVARCKAIRRTIGHGRYI
jgi:hypothetical protein